MDLNSLTQNKNNYKKIRIGLVAVTNENEVLLIRECLKRINKDVYNIPTIEIENLDEKEIINKFNEEYNLKISDFLGFINEVRILDDTCNLVKQINLYTVIDKNKNDYNQNVLEDINKIEYNKLIPENLKNTIDIFKYNIEIGKNGE